MCTHAISCSSFQFSRTVIMVGSDRKYGCSDIMDTFSPTFRNPTFRFSPIVKYESLDNKKSEIFKHPSFRYSPIDFQTFIFSKFDYSQIRKLGFQKSEIFKHPSFQSIFAYIQIRKLRSQKSEISKRPAEHPAVLIFVNIKIRKLGSFRK